MSTVEVGVTQIDYDTRGHGDQDLLLVHGGLVSAAFQPLASELVRQSPDRFRTVIIHRRGYGGSSPPVAPFGIEDQARDCLALMDALGVHRAHIVGHSIGGLIALQVAQVAPDRVRSLSLVEPALVGFIPGAVRAAQNLSQVGALYQAGNRLEALTTFLRGVSGEGFRATMDPVLPPGWLEEATGTLDVFFQTEIPSIRTWRLETPDRVRQPVLSIFGTEKRWGGTDAAGAEFDQVLRSWFPQTESLSCQGSYHWPHVTDPAGVAAGLTRFVGAA